MPRLRVHGCSVSIDGFGAGRSRSLQNPLDEGGVALQYRRVEHVPTQNATHRIFRKQSAR